MPSSTPTESRTFRAAPTKAPACYTISSGVSFRPTASTRESTASGPTNLSTLPVSSPHPCALPAFVSEDSVSPPTISNINSVPVASPHVSTLPASSAPERLHAVPSLLHLRRPTTSKFVTRESSSAPVSQHNTQASGSIDSSYQAPTFGNYDAYASAQFVRESAPVISEGDLASIASAMERITAGLGLPPLQVLKFDGSLEVYPLFKQRFYQLVETKALGEQTKMACLLQFLEGPALHAGKRHEAVPGGLNKALSVLQNRLGQPFKIMKACIDALTKGPVIAPQDKEGLQRFADTALVMYDTLASMNCLTEMNVSNLEKVILRLPRWLQDID